MKRLLSLLFTLIILTIQQVNAARYNPELLFSAYLTGSEVEPAVTTNATGVAGLRVSAGRDTIFINLTAAGLSGPINSVHIHKEAGAQDPLLLNLAQLIDNNSAIGYITGPNVNPNLIRQLLTDSLYIDIHTEEYAATGEIRGKIHIETDYGFTARLSGAQEVPPVATNGYGLGVFNLSQDHKSLNIFVVVQNLSTPVTGAHLHLGAPGVAGPIVEHLTTAYNDSVISIVVDPTDYISALLAGDIYINVHTTQHPAGEVRGQLLLQHGLNFDARLTGSQEVPPVTTPGIGVSKVLITPGLDSLWFDVVVNNLKGAISAAHFHLGDSGVAGPPVVDLTPYVNGNRITGTITGATVLTSDLIKNFLAGRIYVNVHTPAHPAGEIRGQVLRVARKPHTFTLSGAQEVPPVETMALGSGVASIDRENTNVHFMLAVTGLSSSLTGAHFHAGKPGENGPVIFHLTPFMEGSGSEYSGHGYWTNTDATNPFTAEDAHLFNIDSVYANVHTTTYPAGEVRGQVTGGAAHIEIITSVVYQLMNTESLVLAPNPAAESTMLNFTSAGAYKAQVSIADISGKKVSSDNVSIVEGENLLYINLSTVPAGIYYVSIETEKGRMVKKLIKN